MLLFRTHALVNALNRVNALINALNRVDALVNALNRVNALIRETVMQGPQPANPDQLPAYLKNETSALSTIDRLNMTLTKSR
jgi:hypothetical protein